MLQWKSDEFGDPQQVLSLQDVAPPQPSGGEAVLRVLACGVGLPDALMVRGNYPAVTRPPISPGQEIVGVIEQLGSDSPFSVGQRVMATTRFSEGWGGLAETCLCPTNRLFAVPERMSDAEAAGFLIPYHTAYVGLVNRASVKSGESVLILGGAGSSGSAAIQLAKALGAKVCTTARTREKAEFCRRLGADLVIDLNAPGAAEHINSFTNGRGIDVAYDPVGGDSFKFATDVIAAFGRIVVIGYASGRWAEVDALHLVRKSYSVIGALMPMRTADERSDAENQLAQLYGSRMIAPPIDSVHSFQSASYAIAKVERSSTLGKVIVHIASS